MLLVKFGQIYLNFDLVTSVRDQSTPDASGALEIEFGPGHSLRLYEEATALRGWLDTKAVIPEGSTGSVTGGPSPEPGVNPTP